MDPKTLSVGLGLPCLSHFPLGTFYKKKYYISEDCLTCLNEINDKINREDPTTRPLRRALIFLDVLNKDLIPMLIYIKKQPCIFRSTVKLLVWLTLPVGCLVSEDVSVLYATPKYIVHELTQFLYNAKEAFLNPVVTRTILDHLNSFLVKEMLTIDDCDCVNYLLLLIRNILHAPERPSPNTRVDHKTLFAASNVSLASSNSRHPTTDCSQQNLLLKDLFGQGLDRLLINLLSTSQKRYWAVTIAQLIALFFKDQPVESMQKLLDLWINSSSTSSTFSSDALHDSDVLQHSDDPCNSSHILVMTSNPVFIVSARMDDETKSTVLTDMKLEELNLSCENGIKMYESSDNDTQSPQNNWQRKEMRQLICGSRDQTMEHYHQPKKKKFNDKFMPALTQNDISQLLKEFTVYFLLNGYNTLVSELHQQLMEQETLGKSYFLWLITYFLRFTSQMELKIKYLKDVFNVDILCYLTFEAFRKTEEFEAKSLQTSANLTKRLRRLRLNVSAIREYLLALEKYSRSSHKSAEHGPLCRDYKYEEKIYQMQSYLQVMHNLRQLFLLQLRLFNSSTQSRQYLCDVITANHVLLLLLERVASHSPSSSFDVCQHLKNFCTKTILSQYGSALEDFMTNGHFVNDCIFTMLHHIGCDLGRSDLLCDAIFLRSFSKMLMGGFHLSDDWEDLIEYIMQKSKHNFQTSGRFDITFIED